MNNIEDELAQLHMGLNTLSPISQKSWEEIKPFFKTITLKEGQHLIQAEDKVEHMYFMTQGLARYYYLTIEGKEFNKSFSVSGNVVSSISSLVLNVPSPFYLQCLTPCSFIQVPFKDFSALTHKNMEFAQLGLRMLERLSIKKEQREADFLLLDATQRYEVFLDEFSRIKDQIPNYHIASYLGISEVTLSRIRRALNLT
ncbi:MAG: Crp/Fnr family transcriptional regulator [Campylobacteraceae bacterium]|nr:Crp/Fnr family transcriptional regulator [Campylobacteraceae bacterium]